MIEDKLTREERLRLEALAQAVASKTMQSSSSEEILRRARLFHGYITSGIAATD